LTKRISETPLEIDDIVSEISGETEVDILEPEPFVEKPPFLVFLIPGIRTAGMWTQDAIEENFTFNGREIIFTTLRGNGISSTGRLSSLHLVTRININSYRSSFLRQIDAQLKEYPEANVSVFAHSMGSALFADIVGEVANKMKKQGRALENIVFVGSVCHRKHSEKLMNSCQRFINDVGVRDMWPFRASVIRPDAYSDVGLWGFRDGFLTGERYFYHDHTSCTSVEHMKEKLIPLFDENMPIPFGSNGARPSRSEHTYEYFRRAMHCTAIVVSLAVLLTILLSGILPGIIVGLISMILWSAILFLFR